MPDEFLGHIDGLMLSLIRERKYEELLVVYNYVVEQLSSSDGQWWGWGDLTENIKKRYFAQFNSRLLEAFDWTALEAIGG